MNARLVWILGLLSIGALALTGCPGAKKCSPANCGGCCGSDGKCVAAPTSAACGLSGNSCVACVAGQVCLGGQCVAACVAPGCSTDGGGGGGGSDGGASDGGHDGGPSDGGGDAGPLEEVGGSMTVTWALDTGDLDKPSDLSNVAVAALVPADGGFSTFPGTGRADGGYSIPGVPAGTYYLRVQNTFLVTERRRLDLSWRVLGHPDASYATQQGTVMALTASDLAPWQPDDELQLISSNAGVVVSQLEAYTLTPPDAGETSLNGMQVYYAYTRNPLIDGARGDSATLSQLSVQPFDGGVLKTVSRAWTPSPFTLVDGQSVAVSGAFSPVNQGLSLSVDWKRSTFDALVAQTAPHGQETYQALYLVAVPGGGTHGYYTSGPTLLSLMLDPVGSADLPLTLSYGNPFPGSWTVIGGAYHYRRVSYQVGGAQALNLYGQVNRLGTPATLAGGPLQAEVGPPTSPTVDGLNAFAPQTIGLTPRLSWSAPTVGTVGQYVVGVYRLTTQAGQQGSWTAAQPAATFYTRGTSLQLPAGLLQSGQAYFVRWIAQAQPNSNFETAPFRYSLPAASATALSATLTAQ